MTVDTLPRPTVVASAAPRILAEQLSRLESDPTDLQAWRTSVQAMASLGKLDDAIAAQRQVLRIGGDDAEEWHELGRLQIVHDRRPEVIVATLEKAIALAPMRAAARIRLGNYLLHQARLDEAGRQFATVLKHHPESIGARAGAASLLDRKGDLDSAWALLVGARGPFSTSFALAAATVGRHAGRSKEALAIVRKVRKRATGHDLSMLLHHEGDLLDDLGRHEEAWRAWTRGNRERRIPFDVRAMQAQLDAVIALTDELPAPTGPRDPRPVFVVGMPRSGTTLLETMLDSLPGVAGIGESFGITDLGVRLQQEAGDGRSYFRHLDRLGEAADRLGRTYLDLLDREAPTAVRVVDKMPDNTVHLGLIHACLPGARVVWMERDPDDVALSCFQKTLSPGLSWAASLEGIRWKQRSLVRLKEHWMARIHNPVLTVRYEDLVQDPEGQARRLMAFLDLPYDAAMLDFHQRRRHVATASFDQVVEPIHTRAVKRSAPYRRFLSP